MKRKHESPNRTFFHILIQRERSKALEIRLVLTVTPFHDIEEIVDEHDFNDAMKESLLS